MCRTSTSHMAHAHTKPVTEASDYIKAVIRVARKVSRGGDHGLTKEEAVWCATQRARYHSDPPDMLRWEAAACEQIPGWEWTRAGGWVPIHD